MERFPQRHFLTLQVNVNCEQDGVKICVELLGSFIKSYKRWVFPNVNQFIHK